MQLGKFPTGRVFWFRFEGIEGFSRYGLERDEWVHAVIQPKTNGKGSLLDSTHRVLEQNVCLNTVSSLTLYLNKSLIKRDSLGIQPDWSCLNHVALCLCQTPWRMDEPRSNQFNLNEHRVPAIPLPHLGLWFSNLVTLFKEQTRSLPSHEAGAQPGAQELALLTTSLNQSFRKSKNCVLRNCARECRLCTLACFSTCMSDGDVTLSFHTCAVSRGSLPLLPNVRNTIFIPISEVGKLRLGGVSFTEEKEQ